MMPVLLLHIGHDGTYYDADLVHNMSIASLHGEFCTAISKEVTKLCVGDCLELERVQEMNDLWCGNDTEEVALRRQESP